MEDPQDHYAGGSAWGPCLARAVKAGLGGPVVSPRESGVCLPGMFAVSSWQGFVHVKNVQTCKELL